MHILEYDQTANANSSANAEYPDQNSTTSI